MNIRQCGLVLFFKGSIHNLEKNIFNCRQHRLCLGLICIICIMILVFLWWIRALLCLTSINHSKKAYFLPQISYTTKKGQPKKWTWQRESGNGRSKYDLIVELLLNIISVSTDCQTSLRLLHFIGKENISGLQMQM